MTKKNEINNDIRKTIIITTLVSLIPVIAGIVLYSKLPDQVITHWDSQGNPNGWEPKFVGAIVFPGILVLVNLLMPVIMKADPKYDNMDRKLKNIILWIIPVVSIFCASSTLAAGMGMRVNIPLTGTMFLGLLFVVIGNYLPKTKQSYTLGIKLPWTLDNEENWNRTHRIAGFLWVVSGILIIVSCFFTRKKFVVPLVILLDLIIPTVYSYVLYVKMKASE